MDGTNWRAAQGQGGGGEGGGAAAGAMDSGDWRTQLLSDSRQRIVNKIMETLKRHLPVSGQEGVQELKKIAVRFEEKIYSAATSQQDYLRKISLKMLTMETKSQNPMTNSIQPNPASSGQNVLGPGSHSMQSQLNSQAQQLPVPMVANQTQTRQPLLQQNIQNNMASTGLQNSASLAPALPPVSNLTQGTMPNVVGQNSNLQTMQNMPNVGQNSVGNAIGQGMPSNMVANSQRQMQGRQQQVVSQQQQQQSQTTQQYLYQQQLHHHQMMKQKFQQGSTSQSLMQSHMQQQQPQEQQQQQPQQQQNLLQPTQTQPSQQAMMQPSSIQSTSLSNLQQNQQSTQSVLHQRQQSVMRQQQAPMVHQQQSSMLQQPILPAQQHQQQQQQQQQQLIAQQTNVSNLQQNQLMGQPNTMSDVQQRLAGQQNNYNSLQQQQQLLNQQNNFQNMHQQQLGSQSNIAGVQQQQLSGSQQPGNSGLTSNQHPIHMMQQPKIPVQQKMLQSTTTLLPSQGQQSQSQPAQQQMMSQNQSQPGQLQPPGLQQQTNQLQREMQQRLQPSAPLLQLQNVMEQQKQLYQSQRAAPEASSTSLDSTAQTGNANAADWQEEVYKKIKSMKESYLAELNDLYHKITSKVQQHDSLPQRPQNEQIEKLKVFKITLERIVLFLRLNKQDIQPSHKEKLVSVEKHISFFLSSNRPRSKPSSSPLQGQLPQSSMQLQQPQSLDGQTNPSMQPVQGSMAAMPQNNLTNLQHNSLSGVPTISNSQQHMINTVQPGSSVDLGQGNSLNSLQHVATGSLQQNPVNSPQQVNISSLSSQSGTNPLQANLGSLQQNSNALQQSIPKQHEQQMLQNQQLRQQYHHRQMQQQLFQRQQLMQQQQAKQQQTTLLPTHQMTQLQQMTDANDLKIRQQMGMKTGVLQQQQAVGQRVGSHHPQLKSGISSPQLHQALSPQVTQHPSPQIDQQNMLASLTKAGTPLQSASSPFVVPSPSTPLAPSPMPGDSEKVCAGLGSHTTAGNIMHQQATGASAPAQSLAIGTPGISASPLLAEFTPLEGTHANISAAVPGKSSVEQPLERLMKVVKNMSDKALNLSVSDISSVVSMTDRIAGSAPGNGSRAAVGEDLVAMTKCHLQARNYFMQDGPTGTKKMKRYTTSNAVSSSSSLNDGLWQLDCSEAPELESTATSIAKRPKLEVNHALVEEIQKINWQLIDTVVEISDEGVDPSALAAATEGCEGTTVKFSFTAVALSPNLKALYASAQMSPIQPLRLLVPVNYPNCSPILLDKFPVEVSKEYEDLSMKAKSRFSVSLRSLSQPLSLKDIARTWDVCARAVISDYAQQSGGGTFSSKYGSLENCSTAA
ncbi:mediator of RNA polymerase II transcription subunit 15a-like isoform X1 [Solanum dulcamara]|uniref:mediator of RNA polymerase II transcription subunit 15a-like isoform X1 n=1 Tax=Solanum dulcamara TaxID=45834 RepID=UPI002484FAAF|nr:mediator of RNA polymerase II transcription subunit 15a-like isoform X1 [Solanum dulcamara]